MAGTTFDESYTEFAVMSRRQIRVSGKMKRNFNLFFAFLLAGRQCPGPFSAL